MPLFPDPNTAVFALVLGLLGILFEFHAPGTIFPGVIGSSLVLLAAASLSRYPLSPGAIGLIAAATLLFVIELKIQSRGALSATGAILLSCGLYLLVDSPRPEDHIRPAVILAVVLPATLITAFLFTLAAQARTNKSIAGPARILGHIGTVVAGPALRILVSGEYWNATSPVPLTPGAKVRVIAIAGLSVTIEPA